MENSSFFPDDPAVFDAAVYRSGQFCHLVDASLADFPPRDGDICYFPEDTPAAMGGDKAPGEQVPVPAGALTDLVAVCLLLLLCAKGRLSLDDSIPFCLRYGIPAEAAKALSGMTLHEVLSSCADTPALQKVSLPVRRFPVGRLTQILSGVISETTGESFASAAERLLISPLSMEQTAFSPDVRRNLPPLTDADTGTWVQNAPSRGKLPALYTTPHDLVLLGADILNSAAEQDGCVFPHAAAKLLLRTVSSGGFSGTQFLRRKGQKSADCSDHIQFIPGFFSDFHSPEACGCFSPGSTSLLLVIDPAEHSVISLCARGLSAGTEPGWARRVMNGLLAAPLRKDTGAFWGECCSV